MENLETYEDKNSEIVSKKFENDNKNRDFLVEKKLSKTKVISKDTNKIFKLPIPLNSIGGEDGNEKEYKNNFYHFSKWYSKFIKKKEVEKYVQKGYWVGFWIDKNVEINNGYVWKIEKTFNQIIAYRGLTRHYVLC